MEEWSVQRRVKVYRLNAEGGWDDNGTGFVSLKPIDKHASMGIVVQSEAADTGVILESKISAEDIYQRQQDTLIVWNEPSDDEDGIDLAISFQEPQGCTEIWDQLMEIQAKMSKSAFIGKPSKKSFCL
jgi:protein phosphatase-4 regulatory subunit 3